MKISRNRTSIVFGLVLVMALATSLFAYESASYQVVRTEGKFEVRDYPPLTVVEVASAVSADSNFMRLFRFIGGNNAAKQKIAMTTPVFMSGSETNGTMSFVMPAKLSTDQVPKPADKGLVVKQIPAGRFAVLRFRGWRNAKNEAEALRQLQAWLAAQGLRQQSPPIFGYFNPPWTPGFLRRNEVMLRVQATAAN